MKKSLACLLCTVALLHCTQVESKAIVGYINKTFAPGNTLFASQLTDGTDTLSSLFMNALGGVPNGTTVSLWDPLALSYGTTSEYTSGSGWSIDLNLDFGEGALLATPAVFTNTFVGATIGPPEGSPYPHTGLGDGYYLLGAKFPYGGPLSVMFEETIGRAPVTGEQVVLGDGTTSTFSGVAWSSDLQLNVMDAAFFNLGPVVVPEPTTLALLGLGSMALVMIRRRR